MVKDWEGVAVMFVMKATSESDSIATIVPGERLIRMVLIFAPYQWPACSLLFCPAGVSVGFPGLPASVPYCRTSHPPPRYPCAGTPFT